MSNFGMADGLEIIRFCGYGEHVKIPTAFSADMGWVWELTSNPNGSPAVLYVCNLNVSFRYGGILTLTDLYVLFTKFCHNFTDCIVLYIVHFPLCRNCFGVACYSVYYSMEVKGGGAGVYHLWSPKFLVYIRRQRRTFD